MPHDEQLLGFPMLGDITAVMITTKLKDTQHCGLQSPLAVYSSGDTYNAVLILTSRFY